MGGKEHATQVQLQERASSPSEEPSRATSPSMLVPADAAESAQGAEQGAGRDVSAALGGVNPRGEGGGWGGSEVEVEALKEVVRRQVFSLITLEPRVK